MTPLDENLARELCTIIYTGISKYTPRGNLVGGNHNVLSKIECFSPECSPRLYCCDCCSRLPLGEPTRDCWGETLVLSTWWNWDNGPSAHNTEHKQFRQLVSVTSEGQLLL